MKKIFKRTSGRRQSAAAAADVEDGLLESLLIGPLQARILLAIENQHEPLNTVSIWRILKDTYKPITTSALYTVLNRMTQKELLVSTRDKQSNGPGRPRVYFEITQRGREALVAHREGLSEQLAMLTATS